MSRHPGTQRLTKGFKAISFLREAIRHGAPEDRDVAGSGGGDQNPAIVEMRAVDTRCDGTEPRAVVVVEGESDQVAIEALAERRGVDLSAAGVRIERLGG